MSPTCEVLGAAAKHFGAQSIFLGMPGYWAHVRQQPCVRSLVDGLTYLPNADTEFQSSEACQ